MGEQMNDILLGSIIYAGLDWDGQDGWIPHFESI